MQNVDVVARVAAACSVALLVLIAVLARQSGKGKITWDWPFIVAYVLLFLCIAAIYAQRGQVALAVATAVLIAATAVFDTIENLGATEENGWQIVVSHPKWLCFFACVLLTVPLFAAVRSWVVLARIVAVVLFLGGAAGIGTTLGMPAGASRATDAVLQSAGAAIVGFLLADVIFVFKPRVLLS